MVKKAWDGACGKSLCVQDVEKKGTARRYLSTTIQSEVTNVYSLGKKYFLIQKLNAFLKLTLNYLLIIQRFPCMDTSQMPNQTG